MCRFSGRSVATISTLSEYPGKRQRNSIVSSAPWQFISLSGLFHSPWAKIVQQAYFIPWAKMLFVFRDSQTPRPGCSSEISVAEISRKRRIQSSSRNSVKKFTRSPWRIDSGNSAKTEILKKKGSAYSYFRHWRGNSNALMTLTLPYCCFVYHRWCLRSGSRAEIILTVILTWEVIS